MNHLIGLEHDSKTELTYDALIVNEKMQRPQWWMMKGKIETTCRGCLRNWRNEGHSKHIWFELKTKMVERDRKRAKTSTQSNQDVYGRNQIKQEDENDDKVEATEKEHETRHTYANWWTNTQRTRMAPESKSSVAADYMCTRTSTTLSVLIFTIFPIKVFKIKLIEYNVK